MNEIVNKFFQVGYKAMRFLSALALSLMTVLIVAQVLFRYVLNSPLAWTEELARHLFIWMSFLGAGVAAYKGDHIMLDFLQNRLKGASRSLLVCFNNLICVAFYGIISWYCITLWPKLSMQKTPVLSIPVSIIYLGMIIGSIFMVALYLYNAISALFMKESTGLSE